MEEAADLQDGFSAGDVYVLLALLVLLYCPDGDSRLVRKLPLGQAHLDSLLLDS